jgi:hypothetical protein
MRRGIEGGMEKWIVRMMEKSMEGGREGKIEEEG